MARSPLHRSCASLLSSALLATALACLGGRAAAGGLCTEDTDCPTSPNLCMQRKCLFGNCGFMVTFCADGNPCTSDSCDPNDGLCDHVANTSACDDGNPCTESDECAGGLCVPGAPKDCDDDNGCTDDSCEPSNGDCLHPVNADDCDDGDACTTDDLCIGGVCSGTARSCDDDNLCTIDGCDPREGCVYAAQNGACDDGSSCTLADACTEGVCGGEALDCDDHDDCTADSCDTNGGCAHEPLAACCLVSDDCADGQTCIEHQCQPLASSGAGSPPPDPAAEGSCRLGAPRSLHPRALFAVGLACLIALRRRGRRGAA